MTDLERALAAGGQRIEGEASDLDKALAAGGRQKGPNVFVDEVSPGDPGSPGENLVRVQHGGKTFEVPRSSLTNPIEGKDAELDPEQQFLIPGHKREVTHPFAHHETAAQLQDMGPPVHVPTAAEGLSGALNSGLDRYSLGGWGLLLRAAQNINRATGTGSPQGPAATALSDMEHYRHEAPVASAISDIPAYLANGPVNAVAENIAQPVNRAVNNVVPAGLGFVRRLLSTAGTAGGTSGVVAGLDAASQGAEPGQIAERAGEGALGGALVAVPMSALFGAGAKLGSLITNSKGGQARQLLEQRGGSVSPGKVELPPGEYATTGTTDADIGDQAAASAKRGLDMLNEQKKGALRAVGSKIGRIEQSPEAATLHDVSDVVMHMREAAHELDTSPHAKAALQGLIDDITAKQGPGFNPDTDGYMLSESDVNKVRRQLDRYAKTGASNDASLGPLKTAANQVREISQAGPFAEANAEYATESKRYQKSRRLLGINEKPKTPEESRTAVDTVKNRMTRRGQNSVTAGGQRKDMEEFAQRHPDIAAEFEKPELLRAKADIGFHLVPRLHGGLTERVADAATAAPLLYEAAHALSGHGSIGHMALAAGLGTAVRNLPAINARLLYGPAMAARRIDPLISPLLAAGLSQGEE